MTDTILQPGTLPLDMAQFEAKIGYTFSDPSLLKTALTHSSFSNELRAKVHHKVPYNERLEFLGDSVLSIIVSRFLFTEYRDLPEGELTRLRAAVVCEKSLGSIAQALELGNYLYLGVGEEKNHGRERISILADATEAVIAAIFLDAGENGEDAAAAFILPRIRTELEKVLEQGAQRDYKSILQQIIQQADGEKLEYVLVEESGPDHQKSFTIEAHLNSNVIGCGTGRTKREAEQNAAKQALVLFGEESGS